MSGNLIYVFGLPSSLLEGKGTVRFLPFTLAKDSGPRVIILLRCNILGMNLKFYV